MGDQTDVGEPNLNSTLASTLHAPLSKLVDLSDIRKVMLAMASIQPSALHKSQSNATKVWKMAELLSFGPRIGVYKGSVPSSQKSGVWRKLVHFYLVAANSQILQLLLYLSFFIITTETIVYCLPTMCQAQVFP